MCRTYQRCSLTRLMQIQQEFLPGLSFEQLMRQAVGKFDRIVVDSAPVNLVSDTLLYARTSSPSAS